MHFEKRSRADSATRPSSLPGFDVWVAKLNSSAWATFIHSKCLKGPTRCKVTESGWKIDRKVSERDRERKLPGSFRSFRRKCSSAPAFSRSSDCFHDSSVRFCFRVKKEGELREKSGNFQQHFHQFSFPVSPQFRCNSFVQLQSIRRTHVSIAKMWDQ